MNVSGSMTAGVTTARLNGELDKGVYDNSMENQAIDAT